MATVTAAIGSGRTFKQGDTGAGFSRCNGSTQGGVAPADHHDIGYVFANTRGDQRRVCGNRRRMLHRFNQ
jgi:hypothetical protein